MAPNMCERVIFLLAVAMAGTSASPIAANAGANVAQFGLFSLAPGERARLNVVNVTPVLNVTPVTPAATCVVELTFFDESDALPPRLEVLAPRESTSLLVTNPSSRARRAFRAQVVDTSNGETLGSTCIATLELFTTNRTVALLLHQ